MALRHQPLLAALAIAACAPEQSPKFAPPEIEWAGEWLRFGRSSDLEPQCAGVAPYMNRYVGALVDFFELEADVMVDFYYVDDLSTPCESLGCVRGHSAFSLVPVQEHELVHAVRSYEGLSHHFLEEGAAELWGDDSRVSPFRTETGGDLVDAVESVTPYDEGLPPQSYGLAGRFHALLTAERATASNALLRTTSRTTSTSQLDTSLEAETGRGLVEWSDALKSYPACTQAEYRNASAACQSVPLVARCADGRDAPIEVHVGCDDEHTLGPRDGEIWAYRAIELEQTGTYVLAIGPDLEMKAGSVELKQCTGGCGSFVERQDVPTSLTPGRAFEAAAGTYLLRFTLPEGESGDFSIRIAGHCPE